MTTLAIAPEHVLTNGVTGNMHAHADDVGATEAPRFVTIGEERFECLFGPVFRGGKLCFANYASESDRQFTLFFMVW